MESAQKSPQSRHAGGATETRRGAVLDLRARLVGCRARLYKPYRCLPGADTRYGSRGRAAVPSGYRSRFGCWVALMPGFRLWPGRMTVGANDKPHAAFGAAADVNLAAAAERAW